MTYVYAYDHSPPTSPGATSRCCSAARPRTSRRWPTDLGLPVPPAFTISTEACNAYLASGWPDGLDDEIRAHMARLEARVGRRFGEPA